MDAAEIFAWIAFLLIVTLLFFAAFGGSDASESSIEEYMEGLLKEEKINGPKN
tara:strand:+ start:2641 stop:2799 length:159 start_codon:yes stop_codon:yes gene_type:complete